MKPRPEFVYTLGKAFAVYTIRPFNTNRKGATMNRTIIIVSTILALLTARAAFASTDDGAKVEVATCRDGKTYSTSAKDKNGHPQHAGACSGHGGVAKWSDGSPVKSHERKGEYR